jgi:hypothetical protein
MRRRRLAGRESFAPSPGDVKRFQAWQIELRLVRDNNGLKNNLEFDPKQMDRAPDILIVGASQNGHRAPTHIFTGHCSKGAAFQFGLSGIRK